MRINAVAASDVLKAFIQEDRADTRIYRGRVQNICYTLCVASFAISAFLIANVPHLAPDQLRYVTALIDIGLVAIMALFFWCVRADLGLLRRAMKARQDLLNNLDEDHVRDVNPFLRSDHVEPDIHDSDLWYVLGFSVAVVIIKMWVLLSYAAVFVVIK